MRLSVLPALPQIACMGEIVPKLCTPPLASSHHGLLCSGITLAVPMADEWVHCCRKLMPATAPLRLWSRWPPICT